MQLSKYCAGYLFAMLSWQLHCRQIAANRFEAMGLQ